MNKKLSLIAAAVSLISFATGCTKETEQEPAPLSEASVEITRLPVTETGKLTIKFTPSETATAFAYGIEEGEGDIEQFKNETMATFTKVNSAEETTAEIKDLQDGVYTVFAKAYDETGKTGKISTLKIFLPDGIFAVEKQYATHQSIGFTIKAPQNYYRYKFMFGENLDREAFENETSGEIIYKEEELERTYNYFDLKPETEYTILAQGYDRNENPGEIIECKIKTCKEGECPSVEFSIESLDIYRGVYKLVPNELCGMIGVGFMPEGMYDDVITYGFNGNILQMIDGWKDITSGLVPSYKAVGETLTIEKITPDMPLGEKREMYVNVYDKDLAPAGVLHLTMSSPELNPEAGEATADVTVDKITAKGATYHFTKGENVLGIMYETIEADWFDEFMETEEYYEFYMHDRLFKQGYYWSYGKEEVTFTEEAGSPNFRYYACVCPMNENGPRAEGWGKMVTKEYTTLAQ